MQNKQHENCGRIFVCARREDFYAPQPALHFSETPAPQPDEKGGAPRSSGV
ncbi:hypothetical protein [Desulfatibacillum aliphaticivorans]|uniref:hypothetical protein n=1 Tax=Desulfatibacillum aliphaticivorans TaxID=218208 RepID=UPI00041AA5A9|nr:hypothetical protein [Desulfatibacillum aliphaticivorans]